MVWVRLGVFLALAALAGCTDNYIWNQKVTVRVDTPGGLRTGSSVHKVSVTHHTNDFLVGLANGHSLTSGMRGEAVVVDVRPDAPPGEPRYLFLLLGEPPYRLAQHAIRPGRDASSYRAQPNQKRLSVGESFSQIVNAEGSHPVPVYRLPLMVTFRDVADPTSVMRVEPDQLAATFGPGVRLAGVTLEVVDEEVTQGRVIDVLGDDFFRRWASFEKKLRTTSGRKHPYFQTLSFKLTRNDFIQGPKR